jgi:hypothetical protein
VFSRAKTLEKIEKKIEVEAIKRFEIFFAVFVNGRVLRIKIEIVERNCIRRSSAFFERFTKLFRRRSFSRAGWSGHEDYQYIFVICGMFTTFSIVTKCPLTGFVLAMQCMDVKVIILPVIVTIVICYVMMKVFKYDNIYHQLVHAMGFK